MGKLNIAHHKSYHPYRRDNIERVRRDEEEAQLKEAKEEGRMMLADSEARMDLLRQKAGLGAVSSTSAAGSSSGSGIIDSRDKKKNSRKQDEEDLKRIATTTSFTPVGSLNGAQLPTTNGHINLFEDLEHTQNAIAQAIRTSKKTSNSAAKEDEKGIALAPSAKDLNPWYATKSKGKERAGDDSDLGGKEPRKKYDDGRDSGRGRYKRNGDELGYDEEEQRRKREEQRKYTHDPLTSITKQLAARSSSNEFKGPYDPSSFRRLSDTRAIEGSNTTSRSQAQDATTQRLSRESSERERALALIKRKKREMVGLGNVTPSTVAGDDESEYGDQFNRREVLEAKRERERRGWGWDGRGDSRDSRGSGRSDGKRDDRKERSWDEEDKRRTRYW